MNRVIIGLWILYIAMNAAIFIGILEACQIIPQAWPVFLLLFGGYLAWLIYNSIWTVGIHQAKTFRIKGTKIPIFIVEGPKIAFIPYPFTDIDYIVNLATRKLSFKLRFYDVHGFELEITGFIEMRVRREKIMDWCYEFFGGEPISVKEKAIISAFADAFQSFINIYALKIEEIEKLRGPEIGRLIFKGIPLLNYDPQIFRRYREDAERQGWEILTIVFENFTEVGKGREIREKQAEAMMQETIRGHLGVAYGEQVKREARIACWELAKQLAGVYKRDKEMTTEDIRKASEKLPLAVRTWIELKLADQIAKTDKVIITPRGTEAVGSLVREIVEEIIAEKSR